MYVSRSMAAPSSRQTTQGPARLGPGHPQLAHRVSSFATSAGDVGTILAVPATYALLQTYVLAHRRTALGHEGRRSGPAGGAGGVRGRRPGAPRPTRAAAGRATAA